MGKFLAFLGVLFLGLVGWIYVMGAPETEGHAVDANKAADSAGKAAGVVADTAAPWWNVFIEQPWSVPAIVGVVVAVVMKIIWDGMKPQAKVWSAVLVTACALLTVIGLAA